MSYNKLNINGAQADVLSWVTHEMSADEHEMLRNVSRLPCLFKHVALMPDAHLGIGVDGRFGYCDKGRGYSGDGRRRPEPPASSVAKTEASSMKSPAPTKTSTKSCVLRAISSE